MLKRDELTANDVMAVVTLVDEVQSLLTGVATVVAAIEAQLEQADHPLRFEEEWPEDLSATALLVERERWQFLRDALYRRYARRLDMSVAVAQLAARQSFRGVIRKVTKGGKR